VEGVFGAGPARGSHIPSPSPNVGFIYEARIPSRIAEDLSTGAIRQMCAIQCTITGEILNSSLCKKGGLKEQAASTSPSHFFQKSSSMERHRKGVQTEQQ
jgi:hypothetical protein